jgi:hypothetical protein
MGSLAYLSVGKLEVDWSKNSLVNSHSRLFLPSDLRSVPYFYADDEVLQKNALVSTLRDVKPRIELLGYTLEGAQAIYESALEFYPPYMDKIEVDFAAFAEVMRSVDVSNVCTGEEECDGYDLGEYVSKRIFADSEFNRVHRLSELGRDVGTFFENLDPYVQLRLLMENPRNLNIELVWHFHDVVENGWASEDEVFSGLLRSDHFLLVTEGSSDAFIIRRAFELLRPRVTDFFRFVDMEEGYPFSGSGNLHRFCQGLSSIDVLNKILVVYDNDAEGRSKYELTRALNLPNTMEVMHLPDLEELRQFPTIGPGGTVHTDINGRAVAIECFLDLGRGNERPIVRWTSYVERIAEYQGELVGKDGYVRDFKKLRARDPDYDFRRLEFLLDTICSSCSSIAARTWAST